MRIMNNHLSVRMKAVADMVSQGNKVCDVGCDHGYISIYLVQKGIAPHVLAMDINKGPLECAKKNISVAELENYITTRLSDGLAAYFPGEAATLLCAGMGGPLIQKILTDDPAKTTAFTEFVFQPQSEIPDFRRFLREQGLKIIDEDMIYEDGKYYPIMKAIPGESESEQPLLEDRYGPILLQRKHPVLLKYLEKEWQSTVNLMQILEKAEITPKTIARHAELSQELIYLCQAGQICGMGGSK